jgi:hypothetical protein
MKRLQLFIDRHNPTPHLSGNPEALRMSLEAPRFPAGWSKFASSDVIRDSCDSNINNVSTYYVLFSRSVK